MQDRYKNLFPATMVFSAGLMLLGLCLEAPLDIVKGLYHIVTVQISPLYQSSHPSNWYSMPENVWIVTTSAL